MYVKTDHHHSIVISSTMILKTYICLVLISAICAKQHHHHNSKSEGKIIKSINTLTQTDFHFICQPEVTGGKNPELTTRTPVLHSPWICWITKKSTTAC